MAPPLPADDQCGRQFGHSVLRAETGAEVEVADLPDVSGDRPQLVQLFQNLIGNAIKFRREDVPPRVTVDATRDGNEWTFRSRSCSSRTTPATSC